MKTLLTLMPILLIGAAASLLTFRLAVGGPDSPTFDPAPANPVVVATVNGAEIPGRLVDILEANDHQDAVNVAIDQELLFQAGQRWGLEATATEARAELQLQEAQVQNASTDTRLEVEAGLQSQGLPTSGYSDNAELVEFARRALTIARAREHIVTQADGDPSQRETYVQDFLSQERADAVIMDCRIEACP